jgi:hypothetical protein
MKSLFDLVRHPWRLFASAAVAAALAAGCGGGVDSGGTGAPAQSQASGPISGFGSVIVNGVRYEDAGATILDDDGVTRPRSALALGMTVDVDAGAITREPGTGVAHAVATRIQFGSAIRGPVQAVNVGDSSLTVLGQTVRVDADTVFAGSTGLAGLAPGALVGVHALLDEASGTYMATRIERVDALAEYRLRGIVSALDVAARTFSIGGARVSYAGVLPQDLPQLAEGAIARVKLQTTQQAGLWVLTQAAIGRPPAREGADAEVEGYIADFASLASFTVDGKAVDASGANVEFKHGTGAQLANGLRVEVEGRVQDGVIVAREVKIKRVGRGDDEGDDDDDGNDDDEDDDEGKRFTLRGPIESVDLPQRSFVLRGMPVVFDGGTRFSGGTMTNLLAGAEVEVKGVLTRNGTQLRATKIKFGT